MFEYVAQKKNQALRLNNKLTPTEKLKFQEYNHLLDTMASQTQPLILTRMSSMPQQAINNYCKRRHTSTPKAATFLYYININPNLELSSVEGSNIPVPDPDEICLTHPSFLVHSPLADHETGRADAIVRIGKSVRLRQRYISSLSSFVQYIALAVVWHLQQCITAVV